MNKISTHKPWRRLIRTTNFKYSVAFSVLIIISALFLFSTLYLTIHQTLQNEVKNRLTTEIVYHLDYYRRNYVLAPFKSPDIKIELVSNTLLTKKYKKADNYSFYIPNKINHQVFTEKALNDNFANHYLLLQSVSNMDFIVIGKPINDKPFINALIRTSLYLFLITLLLLILLSYIVGIRELRAVDYIRKTTMEIMDGDLSKRIHINQRQHGEIRSLSLTLNEMLERIEKLVIELQQVTNNIAHDLKNPLNRLKSRMEVALINPRKSEYYQDTLVDSIKDIDELIHIFNAMLSIAKINAGKDRQDFTVFNLSDELSNISEIFEYETEEKSQDYHCSVSPDLIIFGHKNLLIQAISNLLHNAIKYTPPKGKIELIAHKQRHQIEITIKDNGTGIPIDQRQNVFKPFYRLDKSRNLPGTGLGLSLVQSIIDLHHAEIILGDNSPGLSIKIKLQAHA